MRVRTVVRSPVEGIVPPTKPNRRVRTVPVSPRAESHGNRERRTVAPVGIAVKNIPAVRTNPHARAIETVKIPGVSKGTVVVPVVLGVNLLLHVTVFVIPADQNIAIVTIVSHDLVKVPVGPLQNRQLRIAARQAQGSHEKQGRNDHPAGHSAHQRVQRRNGQHVGISSSIDPPAYRRIRLRGAGWFNRNLYVWMPHQAS